MHPPWQGSPQRLLHPSCSMVQASLIWHLTLEVAQHGAGCATSDVSSGVVGPCRGADDVVQNLHGLLELALIDVGHCNANAGGMV